jgi:hypothetical protein
MRELKGFNVYMSRDFGEYTLIGSLITGNFIVIEDLEPANYCFIVIAVWESPTDICFSDPSEPECIFLTASGEQTPGTGGIEVSPNPANHFVRITSDEELERVEVFHITGVKIMELSPEGQSCQLSTTGWSPGIFMIIVSSKSRKSSFIQSVIH